MRYTVFHSRARQQFFFSTDHCQRFRSLFAQDFESFVPISFTLPLYLPTRTIVTLDDYIAKFYPGETEIPNPDSSFQPAYTSVNTEKGLQ